MKATRPLLLRVVVAWTVFLNSILCSEVDPCESIQNALAPFDGACRCYSSGLPTKKDYAAMSEQLWESEDIDFSHDFRPVWVGCTRKGLLDIYAALDALQNETYLYKLWVWDSLVPVLPDGIFSKIRPKHVVFEASNLGRFTKGVFDNLASTVRSIELKNNMITEKDLNSGLFALLSRLRRLDLSGNALKEITNQTFGTIPSVRILSLHSNNLSSISEAALTGLRELKRLNLGRNLLTRITSRTFEGLDALEHLNLENNHISHIAPDSFRHMKKLRTLNLGSNLLTTLTIEGLPNLEKLHLNNNTLFAMSDLKLKGLPSLEMLSLDQNHLEVIGPTHFQGLTNLRSLSLASNQITKISKDSFNDLGLLTTLSLQSNKLEVIEDETFAPLSSLQHLLFSNNQLRELSEKTFSNQHELVILSLSKNHLHKIHETAFSSLISLERLYLGRNRLRHLQEPLLESFQDALDAIDLSGNPWRCDCRLLWLSDWATQHVDLTVSLGQTTCDGGTPVRLSEMRQHVQKLQLQPCVALHSAGGDTFQSNGWITVIGVILGVVSILILLSIVLLCWQDRRRAAGGNGAKSPKTATGAGVRGANCFRGYAKNYELRRVHSDMVTLIPKCTTTVIEKKVRFDFCS